MGAPIVHRKTHIGRLVSLQTTQWRAISERSAPSVPICGVFQRIERAYGQDALASGANPPGARPYGGRFFEKPLRAISPSRHQDAQTPPSPRVGEGGRGDEGAKAHGNARAPGAHLRCVRLRRARGRDARAPGANLRCARPRRGGLVGKPRRSFSCFGLRDTQNPPSPRVGEGGRGDEGAHAHGNARASLPRTLPLMRCARLRRARGRDEYCNPMASRWRASPARTRAGRLRTRRKPQVRAPSQGQVC